MSSETAARRARPSRAALFFAAGFVLAGTAGPAAAQQPPAQSVRAACAADYKTLCSGIQPGGGRIMACFRENAAKLSPPCRQALASARAARQSQKSGS